MFEKIFVVAIATCWSPQAFAQTNACVPITITAFVGNCVTAPTPPPATCGMQLGGPAAFCDTFDAPAGIGNRSGQLNGNIWGTSRWTGDMNFGASASAPWVPSTLAGCSGPQPAQPDLTDIIICNSQLRESSNDNPTGALEAGTVTALTMYPKQPFNFAGRTGTISFDVSNDAFGTHSVWPELWISDTPKPTPFLHFTNVGGSIPANAFGVRMAATVAAFQGPQIPNCPSDNNLRWTVDSVVAIRNFVIDDTAGFGTRSNMTLTPTGCVISSSGANDGLNHIEVRVSQNQIDVYATDPGKTSPLVHIATVTNANLSLTQGFVWLEDVHYNADKSGNTTLHNHTFTWDNFAFDGPVVTRDLSFDVLDQLTACHDGTVCLGWDTFPTAPVSVNTLPMSSADIAAAKAQFLMFDAWFETQPTTFSFTLNGHPYSFPWPFPYSSTFVINSFIFPVNRADLVAGSNAITLASDQAMVVLNINIALSGAGQ